MKKAASNSPAMALASHLLQFGGGPVGDFQFLEQSLQLQRQIVQFVLFHPLVPGGDQLLDLHPRGGDPVQIRAQDCFLAPQPVQFAEQPFDFAPDDPLRVTP